MAGRKAEQIRDERLPEWAKPMVPRDYFHEVLYIHYINCMLSLVPKDEDRAVIVPEFFRDTKGVWPARLVTGAGRIYRAVVWLQPSRGSKSPEVYVSVHQQPGMDQLVASEASHIERMLDVALERQ